MVNWSAAGGGGGGAGSSGSGGVLVLVYKNFPTTAPEVKDIIEIADFALKGGILGGGMKAGKDFVLNRNKSLGIPNNVNVSTEHINKIVESLNLLPEEKIDIAATLGLHENHYNASKQSGLPINVPVEKILNLTEKHYWERTKEEL